MGFLYKNQLRKPYHRAVTTLSAYSAGSAMPKSLRLSENSIEEVNEPFYYLFLLEHLFLPGTEISCAIADL